MNNAANKVIWFYGAEVRLTGEIEVHYGGRFYVGSFINGYPSGYKKGSKVLVSESNVKIYVNA